MSSVRNKFGVCRGRLFKIGHKRRGGEYPCPVCGFGLDYPPDDFVICPSCGVEFGYETAGRSFYQLREEWVNSGAHWASRVITEPDNWNPYLQMSNQRLLYSLPFRIDLYLNQSNVARGTYTLPLPTPMLEVQAR